MYSQRAAGFRILAADAPLRHFDVFEDLFAILQINLAALR